ncbi:MAG TPA: hypothetical protein VER17_00520, partial [Tepidisphaeraceae bacterium]|nr:hypothetical protein [Tepidisphaeraceae bacterium]
AAARPTLLIIYLLPNGNTIEMTMGARLQPGMDWHYDIQHIEAQARKLRQIDPARNVVVAYVEASQLSWPAWRKEKGQASGRAIRAIIQGISSRVGGTDPRIALVAHSGGGSFIFGYINGGDTIGDNIERIVWIDANYAYDDGERHGDKLLAWLKGGARRHLLVMAYDDRDVTLNGKKIVSATGGTHYRSHKMIDRLRDEAKLVGSKSGAFEEFTGMSGQVRFLIHANPERKILHTVLVERNGLLEALAWNTALDGKWGGYFWGERAYSDLIPPRACGVLGGRRWLELHAASALEQREAAAIDAVKQGNVPQFLRKFVEVRVRAGGHECAYQVMPDCFAIGSDDDFVRMPLTPRTAMKIAAAMGCTLPTRKMVDDIHAVAAVRLEPKPMTERRESPGTFIEHDVIIERQRAGRPLGELVAGHKKDVVISNRLKEKPNKVAIYGWHQRDGKPIQPLYVGHAERYVDYSHGVRLVNQRCTVDGKETTIEAVLRDPELCKLLSDEGTIEAGY